MRLPWRRQQHRPVHPNEPHAFEPISDAGLATGLAGIGPMDADRPSQLAMTSRYLRTSACGVPGCGRDRDDAIHQPAE